MTPRSSPIALAALLALPSLGAGPSGCFQAESVAPAGVPARRGPLRISVVQRGSLEAKDAVSIKSELEREATILYLIPEGRHVEPGEVLVELDASELADRKVVQEISVQNADASFTKARQSHEIQKSENASAIDAARNAVQFAELDLKKYVEGDWPQELQVAAEEIVLAEEEKARAEERLNWSRDLAEKGFLTRTELEGDELAFNRAEILLGQAKRKKELLIEYDNPRRLKQLEADLEEARRELERTQMRAAARLVDFESAMKTSEKTLELEREKLSKTLAQIEKARIISPVAGMVVYTREDRGRYGQGEPVQEGAQVHEREEILTIPTADGMIAEASVHESVLKLIRPSQQCRVTVDALPGLELDGEVRFVAPLPDKSSWWANPNQRLFRTEIAIRQRHPDMRPGMSCGIEFLVEEIPECLFVPLQCVHLHQGETICFVERPEGSEPRTVEVGRSNDKNVEIVAGLSEGELVLLSPPPGFTPKPAQDKAADEPPDGPPAEGFPGAAARRPDGEARGPGAAPVQGERTGGAERSDERPAGAAPGARPGGRGRERGAGASE